MKHPEYPAQIHITDVTQMLDTVLILSWLVPYGFYGPGQMRKIHIPGSIAVCIRKLALCFAIVPLMAMVAHGPDAEEMTREERIAC